MKIECIFDTEKNNLVVLMDGQEINNVECVNFYRKIWEDETEPVTYGVVVEQYERDEVNKITKRISLYASKENENLLEAVNKEMASLFGSK